MNPSDRTTYTDLTQMALMLKIMLGVYLAVAVVSLWSSWLQLDLLSRIASDMLVSEQETTQNDFRESVIGYLSLAVLVTTAFVYLRFLFLANRNARALGTRRMEYTPGWTVGWFFVPLMNFWKPYQAVCEIFRASHPDFSNGWQQAPYPGFLKLWWFLWLASSVVGHAIFRYSLRADTLQELFTMTQLSLASCVLDIALAIVGILMIGHLHQIQSAKHLRQHTQGHDHASVEPRLNCDLQA